MVMNLFSITILMCSHQWVTYVCVGAYQWVCSLVHGNSYLCVSININVKYVGRG